MKLAAYAARRPKTGNGRTCWVCALPERPELERAHAEGVSPTVMAHWLNEEKGYTDVFSTIRHRLYNHFNGGHVVPAAR